MISTIAIFNPEKIVRAAEILKAVAHPLRLRIIEYLNAYNELSVGDLQELLKTGQSIASQQLSLLRSKGVVKSRKDGTSVFYSLENREIVTLIHCLAEHNPVD